MTAGSFAVDISKHRRGRTSPREDSVAVEEPLEIRLGFTTPDGRATRSISITMRTPGHDADLAAGFLYTESIVHAPDDIASIDVCGPPAPDSGNHNVIRVELKPDVRVDLGRLQRHFYTTSSCGVCGKTSLDALKVIGARPHAATAPAFSEAMLIALPDRLRAAQRTFDATGGLHAAGAFDADGAFAAVREDVGRHNAVDKVVGRLLADGRLPASTLGMLVSGRASFELMQKALVAGMPLLAAVGAPSSLAVRLAREFNMTLVGFLRGETFNVYAGGERLCP
ncbi:MAG: formate dehydrogenase accessory sulfurtransferase FdhD [Woeseiaceae bacterium]|nr:formate dehydrogenase accessory sulfurtransferase FdhD [Woeseiaceae bacterium]